MSFKTPIAAVLLSLATLAVVRDGLSQDTGEPARGADMEALVAAMALGQPGPEHEEIAKLAGDWEAEISLRAMPGVAPMESKASVSSRTILGGRFLELTSHGTFMGTDFESRTFLGFDRRHEEYTVIGLDTLGTYWVTGKGERGADGIIRMRGEDQDPMGKQIYVFEYEVRGDDEFVQRVVFEQLGDQKFDPPFEMVTVRNTRKQ